jgi:hypothetical protein
MSDLLTLSTSSYGEASICLKKYEYHHVLGLVPLPSRIPRPVRRGVWIHRGLEAIHKNQSVRDALQPLIEWSLQNGVAREEVQETLREVGRILGSYVDYWKDDPIEVISTEQALFLQVTDDLRLRATPDIIARTRQGLFIVENKSTREIPPASHRAIDPQTALQLIACWESDDPILKSVEGVLFNYLCTQEATPPRFKLDYDIYANTSVTTERGWNLALETPIERKGKDPLPCPNEKRFADLNFGDDTYAKKLDAWRDEYVADGKFYQRYPSIRPEALLRETARDYAATVHDIREAQRRGHYRRSYHQFNCRRFCWYSNLCSSEYLLGKPNLPLREEEFVIETPEVRAAGRPTEDL